MCKAHVVSRMSRLFLQGAVCPVSPVAGRDGVIPDLGRNLGTFKELKRTLFTSFAILN